MTAQSPARRVAIPPRGGGWHVYPLGFLGAERFALPQGSPIQHRLPRLIPWLDYAAEMGLQGWVLGPVFASTSHGYDTVDHFRIDPRLGDTDDLVAVVAAAHDRGLRIVLDGVFNHVGRDFAMFRQALADGRGSAAAEWFELEWPEGGGEPIAQAFEGHDALVNLNHANQAVVDHVTAVLEHWGEAGVDGWRLDAAYAVPTEFWHAVTDRFKPAHAKTWLFGEVIHGDYPYIVAEGGLDSVTQYELWKAIASSINDANFYELAHALGRNNEFLESFVPVTFLGNHDTTRIASTLDDTAFLPHTIAILFGVGGTPVIYAGDEQGYTGVKYEREGGDDEVRPPFPDSPEEFSELGRATYPPYEAMVAFRNARAWLADARTEVTHLSNTELVFVTSGIHGEGRAAVGLSLNDFDSRLPLPAGNWQPVAGNGTPGPDGLWLPTKGWTLLADE